MNSGRRRSRTRSSRRRAPPQGARHPRRRCPCRGSSAGGRDEPLATSERFGRRRAETRTSEWPHAALPITWELNPISAHLYTGPGPSEEEPLRLCSSRSRGDELGVGEHAESPVGVWRGVGPSVGPNGTRARALTV